MQKKQGDPIAMKMHTCNRLRKKLADQRLANAGLQDIAQPYTLMLLEYSRDRGGTICQRELAQRLHISPAAMAAALKTLTGQGYVDRVTDPVDTRKKLVSITEKGQQAVTQCTDVFDTIDKLTWNGFSDAERQAMNDYLTRIIQNLKAETSV